MTMWAPWMTLPYTFYTQPGSLQDAPFLNGFYGILGAGRLKTTLAGAEDRRDRQLIESDRKYEYLSKYLLHYKLLKLHFISAFPLFKQPHPTLVAWPFDLYNVLLIIKGFH